MYGSFRTDSHEKFFEALGLGYWQSICMTVTKEKSLKVYLDGEIVVDIPKLEGLMLNSTKNIVFLRGVMKPSTNQHNVEI